MSRVVGTTLIGVDGAAIEVEVRISSQLPRVDVVGLPEAAVRESSARVRAAITATGHRFPERRVTVNLAPAGLRKSGAALDLAIAVGILAAAGSLEGEGLAGRGFFGELALDGRVRPVRGALPLAIAAAEAGCREVVVPSANAAEAALAPAIRVVGARDLAAVCAHLLGTTPLPASEALLPTAPAPGGHDLADVRGQQAAKRALEIAAAGSHALLLVGPPGSGKTMLAQRLPTLLPPPSREEMIESTRIHSAAGLLGEGQPVLVRRPFRAPHHTASTAGLFGGGHPPRPGEASLAHNGVLFLDEMPEFDRRSLEALREVLESRRIAISRARYSCAFPARFQLVGACNPCPCGWYRSAQRDCCCDPAAIDRYRNRLSGPLRDRIDLHVPVAAVPWRDLDDALPGEPSREAAARVAAARDRQAARGATNAELPDATLDACVDASLDARALLGRAVDRLGLSARAARRTLRVARTIADLQADARVGPAALAEALQYRQQEA